MNIEITVVNPLHVQAQLKDHRLDLLATIGTYTNNDVSCLSIGTLPTAISVSPIHPLASKHMVSLKDIAAYPAGYSDLYDSFNESIVNLYCSRNLIMLINTIDGPRSVNNA